MKKHIKFVKEDFYSCDLAENIPVNRSGYVLVNNIKTKGTDSAGYKVVYYNGKYHRIHRLVAITFLDVPDNYQSLDINHIDGNKQNNEITNLEWCSRSENNIHAVKNGLNSQAIKLFVKNLYSQKIDIFYSIQETARFFECSGGSVHNYLKHRFNKPFRGHWSIILDGEDWPDFTNDQISPFGKTGNRIDDVIVSLSTTGLKNIITPNLSSLKCLLNHDIVLNEKDENGYIHCYYNDLRKFTEDVHDVLINSEFKYNLLNYNRKPVNTKPKKIKVTDIKTNDVEVYESVRFLAEKMGMTYAALKRSIWRTKGFFKGKLYEYIN